MKLRPQRRERLGDQLYGQILAQIMSGAFREGDKLPSEKELCERFGVSRPTVREALMRLHADGLAATRQGSGTYVQKRPPNQLTRLVDAADVAGLLRCMEVRIGLEAQAAGLAAQRRTAEGMARIQHALEALRSDFAGQAVPSRADFAFHLAVAQATGNDLFAEMLRRLEDPIHHAMAVALGITRAGTQERARRVMEEHEAIAEAIQREDAESASLAMRYHLHRSRQRVTDGQKDV